MLQKAHFGSWVQARAKDVAKQVVNVLNPNYMDDLPSGCGNYSDMYFAIRKHVLWPRLMHHQAVENNRKKWPTKEQRDAATEEAYRQKMKAEYNDYKHRPSGWFSFVLFGRPAGKEWLPFLGKQPSDGKPTKNSKVVRQFQAKLGETTEGSKGKKKSDAIDLTGDGKASQLQVEHKLPDNVVLNLQMKTEQGLHESLISTLEDMGETEQVKEQKRKWAQKLLAYFEKQQGTTTEQEPNP
mmetsp:Transcript_6013/g.9950  ORF Transcript_6013/g.9950 Transcript_6013/m.9950 type:complete len:239 (-) Transcript_6013:211-927(-)